MVGRALRLEVARVGHAAIRDRMVVVPLELIAAVATRLRADRTVALGGNPNSSAVRTRAGKERP
jgi:hypothetical protein